ncbi:MAG: WD40 repeat domain-containing protein [Elainellaceae cyanobacterium]
MMESDRQNQAIALLSWSCLWHPTEQYLAAGGASGKLTLWQQSIPSKGFGR